MFREKLRRSHLIIPGKSAGAVGCKFDVVRRISVNEVRRVKRQLFKIYTCEDPGSKALAVRAEVRDVIHRFILAEWDIEFAASIEAAKAVEAASIQKVEELRGVRIAHLAAANQFIEARTMFVEQIFVVTRFDVEHQSAL